MRRDRLSCNAGPGTPAERASPIEREVSTREAKAKWCGYELARRSDRCAGSLANSGEGEATVTLGRDASRAYRKVAGWSSIGSSVVGRPRNKRYRCRQWA